MLVNPKQSHTGVMCVARLMWIALPAGERGEGHRHAVGAGFLEGVEIQRIDFQAPWRRHHQAPSAAVALFRVQVQLTRVLLVIHQRLRMGTHALMRWRTASSGHLSGNQYGSYCVVSWMALRVSPTMHPRARFLNAAPNPQLGCPFTCEKFTRKVASSTIPARCQSWIFL